MKSHSRWVLVALVVSLFVIGWMPPTVEAPSYDQPSWDIIYNVRGMYPEDATPAWTRTTGGTVSRALEYHGQILNLSLNGAASEKYSIEFAETDFVIAEARLKLPVANTFATLQFDDQSAGGFVSLTVDLVSSRIAITYQSMTGFASTEEWHYEEDLTNANHTYTLVIFGKGGDSRIQAYYDHNLILGSSMDRATTYGDFLFTCNAGAGTHYCEVDYLALDTTSLTSKIGDLEDELDDLKKSLDRLKKDLENVRGDIISVNETGLPTVPHDTRGRGNPDDDIVWLDPFRTTVYSVSHSDSGDDLDYHLPYPTSAEEVTILSDELWIAEKAYHTIWVNTTGGSEILNTTDPVTYFDLNSYSLGGGQNISVQVNGSGASVRVDRRTLVRLIDSFSWGENLDTGVFGVTSKTENEISYNMENVRLYWSWPETDSQGRTIRIDGASIRVQDMDSSLYLDPGRHFEASEIGGPSLELRYLNTSESRTFRIEFTRASYVETVEYFTVSDTDISVSDTYGSAPFGTMIHFTASGAEFRQGQLIIRFALTGKYAGKRIDTATLIIKRSDSSLSQEYTYDSIANELRITDVTISAGDSVTWSLYWDWTGPATPIVRLLVGEPLVVYSLILMTGFLGFFTFTDEKNQKSWRKWLGLAGIVAAVIAVLLLAAGFGVS